jgi:FKBP-type peptidyl-prolyl cis-trans isomerase FkpA
MKKWLWAVAITATAGACNKKQTPSAPEGYQKTNSGFFYQVAGRGNNTGTPIVKGNVVKVHLNQYLDDSLMSSTYEALPEYVKIDSTLRQFDYTEILPVMGCGDSMICLFPTKTIIEKAGGVKKAPVFLQQGEYVKVAVKIAACFTSDSLAVADFRNEQAIRSNNQQAQDAIGLAAAQKTFDAHIAGLKVPLKKLPCGVYVEYLQQSGNPVLQEGLEVSLKYKGKLLDGTLVEETAAGKPFKMHVGEGQSIEGFDKGVAALSPGDRARLYIPAAMAYKGKKKGQKIPAYTNLVFEVEVGEAMGVAH